MAERCTNDNVVAHASLLSCYRAFLEFRLLTTRTSLLLCVCPGNTCCEEMIQLPPKVCLCVCFRFLVDTDPGTFPLPEPSL